MRTCYSNLGEIRLFLCVQSTTTFLWRQSFADAIGTTSVARCNGVKWAESWITGIFWIICMFSVGVIGFIPHKAFLNISIAQSECSWRSQREQSEWAFQVISQPGERGVRPAQSLWGWGGGLGVHLGEGHWEETNTLCTRGESHVTWLVCEQVASSFSPRVTAVAVYWDSGFLLVASSTLFTPVVFTSA